MSGDDDEDDAPFGDVFEDDSAGIIPLEDDATGYLPVFEGDESYDELRLPHERDEAVDPPPKPRARRSVRTPRKRK